MAGVPVPLNTVHGQLGAVTLTVIPAAGTSMFPLSSVARVLIVAVPRVVGVHVYVQLSRPASTGCHVEPPFTDTSTPPTAPPPASTALPLIVVGLPDCA